MLECNDHKNQQVFLRIVTKRSYVDVQGALIPPKMRIDLHLDPPCTDTKFLCVAAECDDIVRKEGSRSICDDCWNSGKCRKEIQPK